MPFYIRARTLILESLFNEIEREGFDVADQHIGLTPLRKLWLAWTTAILLAFTIPFLGGLENAIGLLIIGFGLYQAFVMTKRRDLRWAGPFALGRADGA